MEPPPSTASPGKSGEVQMEGMEVLEETSSSEVMPVKPHLKVLVVPDLVHLRSVGQC